MKKSILGSGGGGNKLTERPVRYGQPARVVNVPGASQLGQHLGNHADHGQTKKGNPASPLYGGTIPNVGSVPLGNETSAAVRAMGQGRTVHRFGSQSATPSAREMPAGRNTLAEYGPELSTSGRKR